MTKQCPNGMLERPGGSLRDTPPLLTDLLDAPKKARVFTKIDLCHAYHLIQIADGEEWKTTFRTRYGSFEWLVMPPRHSNVL